MMSIQKSSWVSNYQTAKEYTSAFFSSSASFAAFGSIPLAKTSGAAYLTEIPKILRKCWDLTP